MQVTRRRIRAIMLHPFGQEHYGVVFLVISGHALAAGPPASLGTNDWRLIMQVTRRRIRAVMLHPFGQEHYGVVFLAISGHALLPVHLRHWERMIGG